MTLLPQCAQIREVTLSAFTFMVYPQVQSIVFVPKNVVPKSPLLASTYFPHFGHSITNLDIINPPQKSEKLTCMFIISGKK